ncbi:MAG: RpiB/LacA/LacB family sugar-phosphate isomerase [Microthrixaceae bacterium]
MTDTTIALGADHAGFRLKDVIAQHLADRGVQVLDLGTNSDESVDYPDYGAAVGRAVAGGDADLGVAVCGSGIGICMAADKVHGVRAGTVHDETSARLARQHNNANVICLGARPYRRVRGAGSGRRMAGCVLRGRPPQSTHRQARRDALSGSSSRLGGERNGAPAPVPLAQVLRLAVRTHEERVEMPWPTERDSELFAVIERNASARTRACNSSRRRTSPLRR